MTCRQSVCFGAVILTAIFTVNNSHAQNGNYAVTQRGADYAIHQKTTVEHGTNRVHKYTELATGLNYTNSYGQLVESKEEIDVLPQGGAAATQGRHKAYFPGDIYSGQIEVVTPDGLHLKSRPLGLSYFDGTNSVLIAELTNSIGVLVSSNQVIYPNAFTDFAADLRYTYTKAGFEQDVVLKEQPPAPESFGLDSKYTRLQLLTEFFNAPEPVQTRQKAVVNAKAKTSLSDTLAFGKMKMVRGKAFSIGSSGGNSAQTNQSRLTSAATGNASVSKSWQHLEGRTFLVEELPVQKLATQLDQLPAPAATASSFRSQGSRLAFAPSLATRHSSLILPPSRPVQASTVQLAKADMNYKSAVVLDYDEVDDDESSFTFQTGTTYLIDGPISLGDGSEDGSSVIFNGGAVIKYAASAGSGIYFDYMDVSWLNDIDHPDIFTSADDNTVGETISGSTGEPIVLTNVTFLSEAIQNGVGNLRFNYAGTAINVADPCQMSNCQFINCYQAICIGYGEVDVNNCLFSRCEIGINYTEDGGWDGYSYDSSISYDPIIKNVTADQVDVFIQFNNDYYEQVFMEVGNSIFTRTPTNYPPPVNAFLCLAYFGSEGDDEWSSIAEYPGEDAQMSDVPNITILPVLPYVSAGNADYYIASNSICHNGGMDLLGLSALTTYAPQDGGAPDVSGTDLGYHYPINEDSDYDGIPDWWIWKYFHSYAHSGGDYDIWGNTLLYDYQNTNDPNIIQFMVESTNDYVNHTNVSVQINVTAGVPAYYAIFANNATTTNWIAFTTTNLTVNLGTTDGVYDVYVGLKGFATNATQAWDDYGFTLDRVAPVVTVTNPAIASGAATVIRPWLQLQGFASESLFSLSYDISNATGIVTNQNVFVTDQTFDTNKFDYTTNWFQAYDVPLATNVNRLTLHITDRAGNMTTTNFNVTLDYSTATNPVVGLTWPTNGMEICQSNFTLRGWTDDSAAGITAQIVSTNATNIISGEVERSGVLWVENLPLGGGTNWITLDVTNSAGLSSETNIAVVKSDMTLALSSVDGDLWQKAVNVSGVISEPSYSVWVNGVQGTNYGDGTWGATNVPVSAGGVASFDMRARSPEGGDPDSNTNEDKPAEIVVVNYEDSQSQVGRDTSGNVVTDTQAKTYNADYHTDSSGAWVCGGYLGQASRFHGDLVNGWMNIDATWSDATGGTFDYHVTGPPDTDEYGEDTIGGGEDEFYSLTSLPEETLWRMGAGDDSVGPDPTHFLYEYFADNVYWHYDLPNGNKEDLGVGARMRQKLLTGGKAGSGKMNLFRLSAGALETGESPGYSQWLGTVPTDIDKSSLRVMGQWLGSDGNLWIALPDNAGPDLNLEAPGKKHYNAGASPTKYTPTHLTACTARDNPDDSRTIIGIGEHVGFGNMPANTIWTVSGNGSIGTPSGGSITNDSVIFIASLSPGSATVTATVDGQTFSTPLTILAPDSIKVISQTDVSSSFGMQNPSGTLMGAETDYTIVVGPTTVSFANVTFGEEPIADQNVSWPDGVIRIQSAGTTGLSAVGCDNAFPSPGDRISSPVGGVPTDWLWNGSSYGDCSWTSTWHDRYKNDAGDWVNFCPMSAKFQFFGGTLYCQVTYQGIPGGTQGPY